VARHYLRSFSFVEAVAPLTQRGSVGTPPSPQPEAEWIRPPFSLVALLCRPFPLSEGRLGFALPVVVFFFSRFSSLLVTVSG